MTSTGAINLAVQNQADPSASSTTQRTSTLTLVDYSPPFTAANSLSLPTATPLWSSLLPTTYQDTRCHTHLVHRDTAAFLAHELDLSRYDKILRTSRLLFGSSWIKLAGRPTHARPLHRQIMMGRSIVITEQMDMHMLWYEDGSKEAEAKIFLKPVPEWLLNHQFWTETLAGRDDSSRQLRAVALGFVVSYSWLICHLSDFDIASKHNLLPRSVTWDFWRLFARDVLDTLDKNDSESIAPRFTFGELRLARMNALYRWAPHLRFKHSVRGWYYLHRTYGSFFSQRFSWITIRLFAYMAIVLTAMQVGLGTVGLKDDDLFNRASQWFAIVSLVLPLLLVVLIGLLFVFYFLNNLIVTCLFNRKKGKDHFIRGRRYS